jgi:hypothetical protein
MSKRVNLKDSLGDDIPMILKGGEKSLPKERPLLVLFYMIGCPHCESNKAAWDDAKKKFKGGVAEIESADAPAGMGFPTMRHYPKSGEPKEITGSRDGSDAILKELGASIGGRRRHRTRRLRHRGGRKFGNRTLRSYITL